MDQYAIFVDAGYLFAQGSAVLTGSKKPRHSLSLDAQAVVLQLKSTAAEQAPSCRLLRIYWYDGAVGGARPSTDQAQLANLDNVKLRLGFVNSSGEQKGVDSLIVTDLIELSRLNSISDAVLLSGDEDVRIGVQIAQNFGVRIHLLGIRPSRGSQSHYLLQEADTTSEWDKDTVELFLSVRPSEVDGHGSSAKTHLDSKVEKAISVPANPDCAQEIDSAIREFVLALTDLDLKELEAYWNSDRGIPAEFDKRLLRACRERIGRMLSREELRHMRSLFQQRAKSRIGDAAD